jgi:hypothetical protein
MDAILPADPNRMVETALRFIEDRIRNLWQSVPVISPSEYEFWREYGPVIWN